MSPSSENKNLALSVSKEDRFVGSLSAEIILILYGDYSVPSSGQAYRTIKKVLNKIKESSCLVYRHFPAVSSPAAYRVMAAVEAAATQDKFWRMHDCLYSYQLIPDNGDLVECAYRSGLNVEQFLAEMASDLYVNRIGEDYLLGVQNGVTYVPTAFINGICYQGEWSVSALLEAITTSI